MKRIFISMTLLAAIVSCGGSNSKTDTGAASAAFTDTAAAVTAAPAEAETDTSLDAVSGATAVANPPSFNGEIILPPGHQVTVTLPIGGTLHSVDLFPGKYVRKGAVLATLENLEFIGMQQNYLEAESQMEYLRTDYERQQSLASQEAASRKQLQQSRADYMAMKSRLEAAAATLRVLGLSPDSVKAYGISNYLEIKAPISGYVTNVDLNAGKYINSGEPLCDILDKSQPYLRLTAYEKDLGKIRTGDKFEFHVNGMNGETFHATLISIDQMVNDSSRSIDLYLKIDDPVEQFRPGMYVTAVKKG